MKQINKVYIRGDIHGKFNELGKKHFPEQDGLVIVCGDFGLWHDTKEEKYWFDWISKLNYTIAFVDGNHENHSRFYTDEFPIVDFFGGKAHQIRDNLFHLIRGEIYNICGKKFFAFGGAKSIDQGPGGALDPSKMTAAELKAKIKEYDRDFIAYRIKGLSWWEEELPSKAEMAHGLENLAAANYEVDYVISHCLPGNVAAMLYPSADKDVLTAFFDYLILDKSLKFNKWYCGHYHVEERLLGQYIIKYKDYEQIL